MVTDKLRSIAGIGVSCTNGNGKDASFVNMPDLSHFRHGCCKENREEIGCHLHLKKWKRI